MNYAMAMRVLPVVRQIMIEMNFKCTPIVENIVESKLSPGHYAVEVRTDGDSYEQLFEGVRATYAQAILEAVFDWPDDAHCFDKIGAGVLHLY